MTDRQVKQWPHWVDEQVQVDRRLVLSRKPDHLPAFCLAVIETVAAA